MYLGRHGPLGPLTVELARTAQNTATVDARFAISRMSSIAPQVQKLAPTLLLYTFEKAMSLSIITNFNAAQSRLLEYVRCERPDAVVNLMPHIWTPLLCRAIRGCGVKYATIIHDAKRHPGDIPGYLTSWLRSEGRFADCVLALSEKVKDQLLSLATVEPEKIKRVFHPDLHYDMYPRQKRVPGEMLRLLFFGRIRKYKGLALLLDAIERLDREGVRIKLGVVGAGNIRALRQRLFRLNAEVINRWINDNEVGPLFARYDATVLPYLEASQSGVAALSFGHALPVIALPVGGLAEQIIDGETGILATEATGEALARAIRRLIESDSLYGRICAHLATTAERRSMGRFIDEIKGAISS